MISQHHPMLPNTEQKMRRAAKRGSMVQSEGQTSSYGSDEQSDEDSIRISANKKLAAGNRAGYKTTKHTVGGSTFTH